MGNLTNKDIARILQELADLMEINGENKYKIRAYKNAGRKLMSLSEDITFLAEENKLQDVKGIGEGIARTIGKIVENGYSPRLEELKTELPAGVLELIEIPGLGPRRAHDLFYNLGINNTADLKRALENKEVRKLDGFGPKIETKLLNSLENYEQYRDLISIDEALKEGNKIIAYIFSKTDKIERIELTGSSRRMKETTGDIDILISCEDARQINEVISELPVFKEIIVTGKTKTSIRTDKGIQVDFRIVKKEEFPAALQYFTGSKEHNVQVRQRAKIKGYKLSEYGLFKNDKNIKLKSEKDIYELLGMQYIIPELRENRGEIEAALNNNLPHSIKTADIRGDLHLHTRFSDGAYSIEDMVKAACDRGYSYIAITDHSQSLRVAHGMKVEKLKQQMEEIDKLQEKYNDIKIIKGVEVDILTDGSLDYSNKILSELELVIASIHTGFNQTEEEITARIINAMENPHVKIIGHPQGRLIGRRSAYRVNMEEVLKKAADSGTCLEINASPYRLDLDDQMAKKAREMGIKMAINTDAHHIEEMEDIKLGVAVARRGWLEAEDVINTLSYKNLINYLRSG